MTVSLSETTVETLYSIGHGYYQKAYYEKALHFFQVLTLFSADVKRHWMGLAACYQMLHEDEKAVEAYSVAGRLDPLDPYPPLYAAQSFRRLGNDAGVKETIQAAKVIAKDQGKYSKIEKELKKLEKKS